MLRFLKVAGARISNGSLIFKYNFVKVALPSMSSVVALDSLHLHYDTNPERLEKKFLSFPT